MNLHDSVVVVTGASSGLGKACSEAFVHAGAIVFGLARTKERLEAVCSNLGNNAHPVACDVADEAQVTAAFTHILTSAGRIDILVNNAGLGKFGRVDDLRPSEWDVVMETNLRGMFLCTRAVVPAMKAANQAKGFGGHIVNVASVAGLVGNPSLSAYNATKFGVRGFSEALMKELRDDGIKVTCVFPGSIATNFSDVAGVDVTSSNPMTAFDVANTIVHVVATADNYLISEVVMRPLRPRG